MDDLQKVIPTEPSFYKDSKNFPWENPIDDDYHVMVFKDSYPVTDGHLLFVPKYNTLAVLDDAISDAVKHGRQLMQDGVCDGFNVGINVGEAAGQTCWWPHVHLILRRKGDMEDPRGGVRHVIPEKGNYKLW